jgi:hypothetical protein
MAFNAKPKFLFDSILVDASLSATDTADGYDVDNITDLRPYTLHKFEEAGTKYIVIDCGEDATADAIGIVGHNLGTAEATVSVQHSANGSDWSADLVSFEPSDDKAVMKEFTSTTDRYWRISIVTSSVIAQLGVVIIGQVLTFPRWPLSGFDPDALNIEASSQTSKAGNILGATLKYVSREISMSFEDIIPSWITNTFKPVWDSHLEQLKPFLAAWDITNHPSEVYFLRIPENFALKMPYNPYRRSLKLSLQGVKE